MSSDAVSGKDLHRDGIQRWENRIACKRNDWISRNSYFYKQDYEYLKYLIPENERVLVLGCGTGKLLAELKPAVGVGIDVSPDMIAIAKADYPNLEFIEADLQDPATLSRLTGVFDYVIVPDTLGFLYDCEAFMDQLKSVCGDQTRIVITYFSHLWEPILSLAEMLSKRMPHPSLNWLSIDDIVNSLEMSDFERVHLERRLIMPFALWGLGSLINRYIAPLPLIRQLCLRHYVVARLPDSKETRSMSTSIVIPCRNERGNIEAAITRMPKFCNELEIIFVEGNSEDGTWDEVLRVKGAYPDRNIVAIQQPGKGKGDAVRAGFDIATNDLLFILDADLTVPPEDMPKFYNALNSNKAEFVNGTRMIYPMEQQAMRFLNYWANRTFAVIFTYLLNQRYTDTLCGTKGMSRVNYKKLARNRDYFGDFDPFGDFDLIFGAAKLDLKLREVPVRYRERSYGSTQISRFRHGVLLLRMVLFAYRKLKAI
ncbi:MAG: glycosyl transferase [Alphaproteobacteria bacterium]|nr:glycosyl transferase [Alphaproteobacteria bacterium]